MRRHVILIVALALVLYGCSAKSNTAVRPTPSAATSASSASVVSGAPSSSQSPTTTADARASDPDANLPPDTAPQVGGGVRCGVERWPVKTLSDGDAANINFTPVQATVAQLRAFQKPSSHPQSSRIAPTELTTFSVTARIVEFKLEADRDVHVVIADLDDPSQTMIVEFPDAADCSGAVGSAHRGEMETARAALTNSFGQPSTTHFTSVSGTATITGVGFFDVLHGQTGVAPNGIELHPVIALAFDGAPAPPSVPPPVAPPPAVVPPSSSGNEYPCEASDCNCANFPSHAEAQRIFLKHGGSPSNNWSRLDGNHDGIACQSLR